MMLGVRGTVAVINEPSIAWAADVLNCCSVYIAIEHHGFDVNEEGPLGEMSLIVFVHPIFYEGPDHITYSCSKK